MSAEKVFFVGALPTPSYKNPVSARNLGLKWIMHFTSFSVLKAYFNRFFFLMEIC